MLSKLNLPSKNPGGNGQTSFHSSNLAKIFKIGLIQINLMFDHQGGNFDNTLSRHFAIILRCHAHFDCSPIEQIVTYLFFICLVVYTSLPSVFWDEVFHYVFLEFLTDFLTFWKDFRFWYDRDWAWLFWFAEHLFIRKLCSNIIGTIQNKHLLKNFLCLNQV